MRRAILLCVLIGAPVLSAQQLPDDAAVPILKSRCMVCHESDIITSQHLSLAGWTNSINKMVRWGSQITPQEREIVQPYLADHFGPAPAASHIAAAPGSPTAASAQDGLPTAASANTGEAVLKRACLACHDANMIGQQHLSKAAWTREVEKMTRWGAPVTDADKEPLVDYLASRFPPK